MYQMKRLFSLIFVLLLTAAGLSAAVIEGPFLILSTPYNEDGSVDYESLVKEARFAVKWKTSGVIWPQSNDSIDLLTREERFAGMAALVEEWVKHPSETVLTLGVSGDDTEDMLVYAREAERLAVESGVDMVLCARPPYYGATIEQQQDYFEALAQVARRPVIIQTYVNDACPTPPVGFLVNLTESYPKIYGWIKEESNKLEANERQREELAATETIKTVFSAWGGWQWLYQRRQNGTSGLISERVAYAPITSCIWRLMKEGDNKNRLTEAYALYRLLIDQRFLPYDSLRGYSLHYFVRLGIFKNKLSRVYAGAPDAPEGSYTRENKSKWILEDIEISPSQGAELDKCYDDMLRFVKRCK